MVRKCSETYVIAQAVPEEAAVVALVALEVLHFQVDSLHVTLEEVLMVKPKIIFGAFELPADAKRALKRRIPTRRCSYPSSGFRSSKSDLKSPQAE